MVQQCLLSPKNCCRDPRPALANLFRTSPVCAALYITVVLGFFVCLISPYLVTGYLTLVPHNLLGRGYAWTVFTYWAFEPNPLLLGLHLICVHLSFAVLESVWGVKELTKMFIIVNLSTAIVVSLSMIAFYALTGYERFYFVIDENFHGVHGLTGFDAAVLMAVVQNMPDIVLCLTPFGRYKNNYVPFTCTVISILLTALDVINLISFFMFVGGLCSAWCYLRFFQRHRNGVIGDHSDSFSFPSFFPPPIQPIAELFNSCVYKIAVRSKLYNPAIRYFDVSLVHSVAVTQLVATVDSTDTERRKQKALRDLNDRLLKTKEQQLSPWEDEMLAMAPEVITHKLPSSSSVVTPEAELSPGPLLDQKISPKKNSETV